MFREIDKARDAFESDPAIAVILLKVRVTAASAPAATSVRCMTARGPAVISARS